MMKRILVFLLLLNICDIMAQTPQTDCHWIMNNTFNDEFDGTKKNIWQAFPVNAPLGSAISRTQNIQYGSENGRSFLRFVAEVENGTIYSGGLRTGPGWTGYSGLGYGYYEIEARVLQMPNIVSGLWPAFWTQHSYKPSNFPPYWYEEINIFEPNNCQVRKNEHHIGYWCRVNDNNPTTNVTKDEGIKYNVDMSLWHKYAVEWLPGRLSFYLDDEVFFIIGNGKPTPYHQNPNLWIDLQVDLDLPDYCPPNIYNGLLGYYDINYFRYYELNCSNTIVVNEIPNFSTYNYSVKKSISMSNLTNIPTNSNISLRATDFIELKQGFEVPLGTELHLDVASCEY